MEVIKRTIVKQVLTEETKEKLFTKYKDEEKRLVTECEQLDFERRKALKYQSMKHHEAITMRFNEEIERRREKVKILEFQMTQLKILPLGAEIVEKEIQTIHKVKVGDDWNKVMSPSEIIIKDGIISELRT